MVGIMINFLKIGLCSDKMKNWVQYEYDISMDIIITIDKIYNKSYMD